MTVLRVLLRQADRQKVAPTALRLPELLLPFFHESGCTRELSILLCKDAMEVAGDTQRGKMKKEARNIVLPLFIHLHDQDQSVAQASWEALLCAAKLLKRKRLRYLLKTAQTQRIGECLLVGHGGRVEQFLEQSLSYLWSPQEPLQEAAIRFIGLAGQHLRDGREEKLDNIIEALRSLEDTGSPSVSTLVAETVRILRTAPGFSLQAVRSRLFSM
ncbi:maestro heat-like repeat-containing protein family member 6 [Numida meleagris]|uniref:maestro heat-like repeat-containing protein family member 6 n=1 Tax=Numida meleagris TaxID=8996 RepID=UPI000B3D95B6|nr:maestro heat-like repeat-containing protein family member 6 [Numida meleagris]